MRAAVLTGPGRPTAQTFEEPSPATGHVVLDVLAAPINGFDLTLAGGRHPMSRTTYPTVTGFDGVGRSHDGRLVYFENPTAPYGSMAERVLVSDANLIELPADVDPTVAATLGNAGAASWLPLSWRARLQPGETVAVLGAAGMVGGLAVQAALHLGAGRVVAVVRGAEQMDRAGRLGASTVIDTALHGSEASLVDAMQAVAPGGFDVVLDYLWGIPVAAAIRNAALGARVVSVGAVTGDATEISALALRSRGTELLGFAGQLVPRQVRASVLLQQIELTMAGRLAVGVTSIRLEDVGAHWEATGPTRRVVIP